MVRDNINLGNKTFDFKNNDSQNNIIESFINQYYFDNHPPDKIVIPDYITNIGPLKNVLFKKYNTKTTLIYPSRKPFKDWFKICELNTNERLNLMLSTKLRSDIFSCLNKDLKCKTSIRNPICFDISHMSGSNMQGSAIWYSVTGPGKKMYRKYNLTNVKKSDDYAAMRYVLTMRL